jgi:lysozyme
VNLIKKFESLRLKAYLAPEGKWTIGYGHVILHGEEHLLNDTISAKRAENLLRGDLREAETGVTRLTDIDLTQAQFDALTSFVFNLGAGAFGKSTLRKRVNQGDPDGAALEFDRWIYATVNGQKVVLRGLVRRRAAEAELFQSAGA